MVIASKALSELPHSIGKMEKLETLMLQSEVMKTLPDSIGDLQNLKSIDLRETFNNYSFIKHQRASFFCKRNKN